VPATVTFNLSRLRLLVAEREKHVAVILPLRKSNVFVSPQGGVIPTPGAAVTVKVHREFERGKTVAQPAMVVLLGEQVRCHDIYSGFQLRATQLVHLRPRRQSFADVSR
jgi:hypothetical protein